MHRRAASRLCAAARANLKQAHARAHLAAPAMLDFMLPAELPAGVKLFVAAMLVLNVAAVAAWGVCLCREARAPAPGRVRVRKEE